MKKHDRETFAGFEKMGIEPSRDDEARMDGSHRG